MDHVWAVLIMLAFLMGASMALSFFQERNLARTYIELRRQQPVAIGKHKRLLNSGAIVMFAVAEGGCISDARVLTGVTVASRFRRRNEFIGMNVLHLNKADLSRYSTAVQKAVVNASDNYLVHAVGGIPQDPPGAWQRLGARFSKKKTPQEV